MMLAPGSGPEYGPSNHRGDTERGALTSGTRGPVYGIGDRRGPGAGNWGLMGREAHQ